MLKQVNGTAYPVGNSGWNRGRRTPGRTPRRGPTGPAGGVRCPERGHARPVQAPSHPGPGVGPATPTQGVGRLARRLPWVLAGAASLSAGAAALLSPGLARSAAAQDWSPFALVAGLLLVGLVADEDGLFEAAGRRLARLSPNGLALYGGAVVLIVVVTTLLNLDTSVAFLTPVLVYTARSRGEGEAPCSTGACSSPMLGRSCCPDRTSRTSSWPAISTSRAGRSSGRWPRRGWRWSW